MDLPGIPIRVCQHLPPDAFYFATEDRILYASPEALRWFFLLYLAGDWPVRDFAAEGEC